MDFSQYGEPSEEWTSFVDSHPIIDQGWSKPDQSLNEMHTSGNAFRAAHDSEKLKASGLEGKFKTQVYTVPTRDGSSIPLKIYLPEVPTPPNGFPVYVYFHGGGFLNGSPDTEKTFCASVATTLNITVLHVCPRHTHEAKHPIPHHDAWDAIEWIIKNVEILNGDPSKLVIGGISSGANLAAAVTHLLSTSSKYHDVVHLQGQVLVVPWLIQPAAFPNHLFTDKNKTSLVQCSSSLGLPTARLEWLSGLLEADDITDVLINPALADDKVLAKVPKTAIIVGGGDPLRDQGLLYATRLKDAG
ncbi:hypothetical protein ACMFMF_008977 [Clarireedia jacksonii]